MTTKNTKTKSFEVNGENLLKKIKELIHQGNIRKIIIEDKDEKSLIIISVTIATFITLIFPPITIITAIFVLLTECTVRIETEKED
ncbi:MAG: hypothetical protein COU63_00080 [Candidatus Pacebacteria bacterium CG10_big_fil_rev_8_21_14_0_10_36_11]|nr:DUF4342 domain-containing protein [Candidatus Pacearchaeota archaeon]OIP74159.1 MAG: hypothetical protein AUK08_02830 [Candidatus Pacebacteria bacterium CG2_30_36_39]PIR65063.1 MAG: hypothetical protein COU63_00080 [Candidatus Pacebacteria bacterium CG10_big_fil_rev_8_21_14_0_10_36_11]PJC43235.1 MAG: hypothetical protein CO040_00275 [Candidatus Pacebacteria bacterium CG_4_9_14_0_2_um_filter_36_8]